MSKMLLITHIDWCWVPSDRHAHHVFRHEYENILAELNAPDYSQVTSVTDEMVVGTRFSRMEKDGTTHTICLGLVNEASKALSYPLEMLEKQSSKFSKLQNNLSATQKTIQGQVFWHDKIMHLSIWGRIKFLFTRRF